MSAPPKPSNAGTTGESLYDVINERGAVLLLGVTPADACRIIDEYQAETEVHPQWRGDMQIVPAQRGPSVLEVRTDVLRDGNRPIVRCEVDRLIPSGLTVDELFAMLRPQLEEAMRDAAVRDPETGAPQRSTSVQVDMGMVDPGISIRIYSPAACLAKLDEHLAWVQATVERFVTGRRSLDAE